MTSSGQWQDFVGTRQAMIVGISCVAMAFAALVGSFASEADAGVALTCFGQTPRGGASSGDDVIIGTAGPDTIAALEGNDRVCGRGEGDDLEGNAGIDRIAGDAGNDEASGGTGGDILRGAFDDDLLAGQENNDELRGGRDDDTLNGGAGNDVCYGGPGVDIFISCEEISDPDQPGADVPETTITKRPKKTTTRRESEFKFKSDTQRAKFECKLDKGAWKKCSSPYRRWTKDGRHRFKVRAIDRQGDVDPSPAKRRWQVVSSPRH